MPIFIGDEMRTSILNLIKKYEEDLEKMESKFQKAVNFMTSGEHMLASETHKAMVTFYKKVIKDLKNLKE